MRAVGNHRGARTISLALAAGLVAFEAVLVLERGSGRRSRVFFSSASPTEQRRRQGGARRGHARRRRERHRQTRRPPGTTSNQTPRPRPGPDRAGGACRASRDLDGLADIPRDAVGSRRQQTRPVQSLRRQLRRGGGAALGRGRARALSNSGLLTPRRLTSPPRCRTRRPRRRRRKPRSCRSRQAARWKPGSRARRPRSRATRAPGRSTISNFGSSRRRT